MISTKAQNPVKEVSNQLFEAQASMEKARGIFSLLQSYFQDDKPDIMDLKLNWPYITTLFYVLPDYLLAVDTQMEKVQEAMKTL